MRILSFILTLLVLASCGQNKTTKEQTSSDTDQKTAKIAIASYKILSEKDHVDPRFGFNKCNILVELKSQVSKEELTAIANEIRKTRKTYDKLWIGYYLESMKDRSISWATTNFTPNLEVEILGATDAVLKKMNEATVNGKVIGKWQDTRPLAESSMILYEKEGKIFMQTTYHDGSSSNEEFVTKKRAGKICYELKVNTHSEYYIVESNKNLGMYGNDGKFGEALKHD